MTDGFPHAESNPHTAAAGGGVGVDSGPLTGPPLWFKVSGVIALVVIALLVVVLLTGGEHGPGRHSGGGGGGDSPPSIGQHTSPAGGHAR